MSDNRQNIKQINSILEKGYLNGYDIYRALEAGINNILPYQDKLDEINVFPVPDGDTGTNMCFTLLPIVEQCADQITEKAEDVYNVMADTALESARGNSGTIIAQFFHGMRKSARGKENIYIKDFAEALEGGYNSSIDSLLNPKEGTIITVMRDVSNKAMELSNNNDLDYQQFLNGCYNEAEESLQRTKTLLKILKKTNVVDAGALGFVLIIQGILNSLEKNYQIQSKHLNISYDQDKIDALKKDVDFTITNKYCTECAIEGSQINREELKETIRNLGDSIVFAGTKNRVKVHIHTNEPGKFFKICNAYGNVIDEKVDDMTKQERTVHHLDGGGIAIVVDSGADIPEEYTNEIQVVPVRYSFGREQHIDGVTQTSKEFYRQMIYDSNHPKTSQPTPGDFKKSYNFISSHYDSIISLHLSKEVSGTYQSAYNASKNIKSIKTTVIDSWSASVGLGLLAIYAVDLKQNGKSYQQIISMVEKKKNQTQVFLVLNDLSYIVKGGRAPAKIKTIANILRLRPVLGVKNGKLKPRGVLYGKSKMVEKFAIYINKKMNKDKKYRVMIAHANSQAQGEQLLNLILSSNNTIVDQYVLELGCALGAHAGPGALVVGFQEVD